MPAPKLADAQAALAATIEPLRNLMAAIEFEINERETELSDLRKRRTETSRALNLLDPQWAADHKTGKPGPKPGQRPSRAGGPTRPASDLIGPERVAQFEDYLRTRYNGQIFSLPEIVARPDWFGWHRSQVNAGLRVLHERGVLRLDRKQGKGGAKFYAFTSEGGNE